MNLILDWGNTQLKLAVFEESKLVYTTSFTEINEQKLNEIFLKFLIKNIILSSVVNHPNWLNYFLETKKAIILNYNTHLPIKINYSTPQTLGKDRIANAVAAASINPNQNNLVIDIGTCIKFDFVSDQSEYLGGAISPGFSMRLKALNQNTDQLPLLNAEMPEELIGNSTKNSILSGVYFGMVAEIDGIINQYSSRYKSLNVLITGGDAFYFEKALKNTIFAHSFLTLYGLNEILNYNEE